jgi:hypothetical protein
LSTLTAGATAVPPKLKAVATVFPLHCELPPLAIIVLFHWPLLTPCGPLELQDPVAADESAGPPQLNFATVSSSMTGRPGETLATPATQWCSSSSDHQRVVCRARSLVPREPFSPLGQANISKPAQYCAPVFNFSIFF